MVKLNFEIKKFLISMHKLKPMVVNKLPFIMTTNHLFMFKINIFLAPLYNVGNGVGSASPLANPRFLFVLVPDPCGEKTKFSISILCGSARFVEILKY